MLSNILCSLFLICADVQSPAIDILSADDGLPTWSQVTPHATPIIQRWEGTGPVENCGQSSRGICYRAYLDTIAEPDVPTIGHGQTRLFNADGSVRRAVRMGDLLTAEEADRQFSIGLQVQYWQPYRRCLDVSGIDPRTEASFVSLTWNIGTGGVCRSTALRRLNGGDLAGACEAMTWWNRAGGRVVRGLVNRRADEKRLCLQGWVRA
jgi:lysozyme